MFRHRKEGRAACIASSGGMLPQEFFLFWTWINGNLVLSRSIFTLVVVPTCTLEVTNTTTLQFN